jgi:hypothetical protein
MGGKNSRPRPNPVGNFFRNVGRTISRGVQSVFTVSTPKKDRYIDDLKRQLAALRGDVARLDGDINRPLFDTNNIGIDVPGVQNKVDTNKQLLSAYGNRSGLKKTTTAWNQLYQTYYGGYRKDENIIHNQLEPQIDFLKKTELTGIDIAFESVKNQNNVLTGQIKDNREIYSTAMQKVNYQMEKMISLKGTNFLIFVFYYLVILYLFYVLFFVNVTITQNVKIAILVVFILYPFIIDVVQQFFYFLTRYIFAIMNGDAYTSNNY